MYVSSKHTYFKTTYEYFVDAIFRNNLECCPSACGFGMNNKVMATLHQEGKTTIYMNSRRLDIINYYHDSNLLLVTDNYDTSSATSIKLSPHSSYLDKMVRS